MKRKIRLITGGIITLLIVILFSYYLGFWGEKSVKLDVYSQEENDQVYECLTGIHKVKDYQEEKFYRDKLTGLSFQGNQNILHYAFNHGNPDLLRLLANQPTTLTLFEPKDSRGNTAMAYYHRYCKFSNLKPLQEETLAENPLTAINHIVEYFDAKDICHIDDDQKSDEALTLAIERGELDNVKNFLFSTYGNNDKSQWEKPLKALSNLRSHVAHKDEIESLLSTLKADRKEDGKFWQQARKLLSSAPNVEAMVNYLHKLVATSPQKKSLLYYIIQIGGLRGYQMYKHIEKNHAQRTKTDFSDLFLAANDPHHPIELTLDHKDEYQQRLEREIANLKGYIYIDANKFAKVNPKDRRAVQQAQFDNMRTFFHACVLNETPEKLELCCTQYFKHDETSQYEHYWQQKDVFGLTPADYFPLVKDPAKKQHLRFLQDHILAPTKVETDFLHTYKTKAKELELGNLNFDSFSYAITGLVFTKQKDTKRNICHIAALLGDIKTIAFLSQNYPDFTILCEAKDAYGRTAQDYAKLWLDKGKSTKMCLYLTTQFDMQGQLTKAAVAKAIQQSNWQQIVKWKREEPIGFGAIWAKDGSDLLQIAMSQQKPTTHLAQDNYFKLLKQLSNCDAPTQKMVQNNKALLDEINVPISSAVAVMREKVEQKAKEEDNAQLTGTDSIQEISNKLETHEARFIPDHTNQNKTILHTLLPKVAANATAAEFETLLNIDQENFKIALCMVDDNKKTPLDLIKKALKDKKNNAKEVTAKFDIIKKYEDDHLATYQSKYKCNTKATADVLYKKDNIFGLVAYLSYPASYMSRSLLETMIKDGAYDVLEKVFDTNNPYVISAAKALTATQKDDAPSLLTALLKNKTVQQTLKCRYLLKEGEFIQKVVTPTTSMSKLKQIERMWKAYPVYCAIMANRYWNKNAGNASTFDETRVLDKLYEMYRFVITDEQKKLYGFNNAHVAVIGNQLALLEKYAKNKPIQLERWLNETDHMGRTPLYYINYGHSKTNAQKKALFKVINSHVYLNAAQILKSPTVTRRLSYIKKKTKKRPSPYVSNKVRQAIFLSSKKMLEQLLAQKEKAGRSPLHYACLGMDSDLPWLLELLQVGHYTQAEIAQEDINGCRPIDYVPEDRKAEFQPVFDTYSTMAVLADSGKAEELQYLADSRRTVQYLAQEALNIYQQNHQDLVSIKECAQSIADMLEEDDKLIDNELSTAICDEFTDNLRKLKEALERIDTNDLGEAAEKTITQARYRFEVLALLKDDNSLNKTKLNKKKEALTNLVKLLKDIDPFTCKVSTLQSLKTAIDPLTSLVGAKRLIQKVLHKLANKTTITQETYNAIETALKDLGNITISGIDSKMGEKLPTLVTSAKAYKPNTQKLSHRVYGRAKKFWRKDWIANLFEGDSWSSFFALDTIEQDNYLPTLYSQLLKPEYAHIAKSLITMHDKLEISLNEQDSEGKTWLLKAIEKRQWDIAKCLVEAGVDLSIKDIYDTNAQFLTIVYRKGAEDLKTQLLRYIKAQQKIANKRIVDHTFEQGAKWVIKRFKQIFYRDVPTAT